MAVIATVLTMSVTVHPRLRSFTGLRSPCSTGPIATAFAERWTALYATLPASRSGKMKTVARPATSLPGSFCSRDAHVDGGVVLDRALDLEVGAPLHGRPRSPADGVDVAAAPGIAGRVREHRDPWLDAEGERRLRRADRDVGELFGVRRAG